MPKDDLTELFFWVDEHDKVLGKITRKEAHSGSMKIHRTVGILVFDTTRKHFLLQQRSLNKDLDPGQWSISAGGHVTFPNNYEESARRELLEELGGSLSLQLLGKFLVDTPEQREITTVFEAIAPKDSQFNFDRDEIQQLLWVEVEKLGNFVENQPFSLWAKIVLQKLNII